MSKKNNRTKNIKVRTTEAEFQAIQTTAKSKGLQVSKYIRSLCTADGAGNPVCYSYHYDTDSVHCHMIISTTSFLPNTPALTGLDLYKSILSLLNTSYFSFRFIDEGGLLNV